jgi:hypothetical protein
MSLSCLSGMVSPFPTRDQQVGKCDGRKSHREAQPETVTLARKLRRKRPKGGQLSLHAVSKELAAQGYLNERGKPYAAKSVTSMLRTLFPPTDEAELPRG